MVRAAASALPEAILFQDTHEYVIPEEGRALLGVSEVLLAQLGEVTYVELPEMGETFSAGDTVATLGTLEQAYEVTLPVSGTILSVNVQWEEEADTLSKAPYTAGWLLELELTEPDQLTGLLSAEAYFEAVGF
jgi:glycine cleavage system H protein